MCLATVYVERNGEKEELMRDVAWVKPTDCGLRLMGLMGETRLVQAKIKDIDLMSSSITLQGATSDSE